MKHLRKAVVMKYMGTVTELNSAMSLADSDFDLTAVIVTKERIAIEWQEASLK